MKQKKMKILSVLLALTMLLTLAPLTVFAAQSGNFEYNVLADGTAEIKCKLPTYSTGTLEIPSEIEGYTVSTIASYAFNNTHYTGVVIPETVKTISNYGFALSGLKSITIPGTVEKIGQYAFLNSNQLKEVTISDGVKTLDSYAFFNCPALTSVEIPGTIEEIGSSVFRNDANLKNVTIHEGVKILGNSVFENCTSLTSVVIPDGVTKLYYSAFNGCTALEDVTIPSSVTSIGSRSFEKCDSLANVYYGGTQDDWGNIKIDANNDCLTNANITYAEKYSYTLSYEANGGEDDVTGMPEFLGETDYSFDEEYAWVVSNATPEREGYTFKGWSRNPAASPEEQLIAPGDTLTLTPDDNDVTLYAVWEKNAETQPGEETEPGEDVNKPADSENTNDSDDFVCGFCEQYNLYKDDSSTILGTLARLLHPILHILEYTAYLFAALL